jgi:formate dehydrogenase subunit gamma
MLASGSIMKWFGPFPLSWRTGATFVHDWLAFFLVITITGHIGYALRDGDALRAMVRGWIPASWARRHAPRWWDELNPPEAPSAPPAAHSSAPLTGAPDAG